jgi:histone acetyltransferase (RNA polymerase elongator complex component)
MVDKIVKLKKRGHLREITLNTQQLSSDEGYKKAKREYVRLLANGMEKDEAMTKSGLNNY